MIKSMGRAILVSAGLCGIWAGLCVALGASYPVMLIGSVTIGILCGWLTK